MFRLSPSLTLLPVIHESGDYALTVREMILDGDYDCLAVALPPSFAEGVLRGIDHLPEISVVVQREPGAQGSMNYVPIDPCQGMIMGIRIAMQERIPCEFIDRELDLYEVYEGAFPDPYALKRVPPGRFLAALLPAIERPAPESRRTQRIAAMAYRLHLLEEHYHHVLFLCSVLDWPWIREAWREGRPFSPDEPVLPDARLHRVSARTLFFMLGELPYITYLYEKSRKTLTSDANLSIDGVKELLLETRRRWESRYDLQEHHLNPQVLNLYMKYVRNLTLMERRFTPDLYTLAVAAKQIGGDSFAVSLVETSRDYPYQSQDEEGYDVIRFGMEEGEMADGEVVTLKNRLAGEPKTWRTLPLKPQPEVRKRTIWKQRWNPFGQCSWTPEDNRIESFNLHVREQSKALIGEDLARTEKFVTSVKDGIDIRETLRHWYAQEIYVKEIPPSRGHIEVVVLLFEKEADSDRYAWRQTWYAEHHEESTLCFYATPYLGNLIGPGIGQSTYGGCFLLFPPRPIPNVWEDSRFDFARTLEERLVAGALFHSSQKLITLVSPGPPSVRMRRIARQYRKKILHIPLSRFSLQTLQRLRRFHVLNGKHVRSFASQFIRDF
ncbi:MAG: hypothetical protein GXP58_08815 [Deltaproteobacteria bacterium]|nr:hypothetical protein [Deltaproteobacteria bacterium]